MEDHLSNKWWQNRHTLPQVFQENLWRATFVNLTVGTSTLMDYFYSHLVHLKTKPKSNLNLRPLMKRVNLVFSNCRFYSRLLNVVFENSPAFPIKWLEQQLPCVYWQPGTCFHGMCKQITIQIICTMCRKPYLSTIPHRPTTYQSPASEESGSFVVVSLLLWLFLPNSLMEIQSNVFPKNISFYSWGNTGYIF